VGRVRGEPLSLEGVTSRQEVFKMSTLQTIERILQEIGDEIPKLKQRVDDLDSRTRARKWAGGIGGDEMGKFSLFKALRGLTTNDWTDATHEREVLFDHRVRDLGTSPDSAGGYLVPSQEIPEMIEMLRAQTAVVQAGATVLSDLKGSPVKLPKQSAGATAYWVGEGSEISPSDLSFGQVVLTPRKVAAMCKLSNELLSMSLPQAESVVRQDLVQQLSLAIDLAALRGSGAVEPQGVAQTPGIGTVSVSGTLTSLDPLFDAVAALEGANALRGKLGFVCHPAVKAQLRKLKAPQFSEDPGGMYMLPPLVVALLSSDRSLEEAVGYPLFASTQIPINLGTGTNETEIYFGNWQDLVIGQWAGLAILASPHAGDAFAKDQVWIRVTLLVDVALRHPESFCMLTGVQIPTS
jgi:HK97 family phage major capsid protein